MVPDKWGVYTLLSNLYAVSGKWGDIRTMRVLMDDKDVLQVPGYSRIEVPRVLF